MLVNVLIQHMLVFAMQLDHLLHLLILQLVCISLVLSRPNSDVKAFAE